LAASRRSALPAVPHERFGAATVLFAVDTDDRLDTVVAVGDTAAPVSTAKSLWRVA
jgi:hypothetical protein